MVGMIVPSYFRENPIDTGIAVVNQVLTVLLTLPMFVGAFVACVLDNTVSGATREQRGLRSRGLAYELGENNYDVYAFPAFAMKLVEQVSYLKVLPFIPKEKKITNRVNDSLPCFHGYLLKESENEVDNCKPSNVPWLDRLVWSLPTDVS
ncbi:unnamed protein product [Onchocerca flexuosa]|uniref:Sulfate_transp domain-containing protein n=1 Tax=Onchocerca flexuosa TaxID=387005 RepID=A0A183H2U4_9BILA|nr:unnamed protein product [Onchocerca flexuosa]